MLNTVCSPSAQTDSIQSDGRSVVRSVLSPVMKKPEIALSNSSQESVFVCMMVEEFRGHLTSGLETIHRLMLVFKELFENWVCCSFRVEKKEASPTF
jgi:hypothetical protein